MSPLQIAVCCLAVVGMVMGKPTYLQVGVAPVTVSSQYHAQDALGQYSYGYSGGPSAKVETKNADGVTRGGYSYIDANGVVQSANYIADDSHGFSIVASNLPQHIPVTVEETPEVAAAKAAHAAAYSEAAAAAAETAPEESDQILVAEDAAPVINSYSLSTPVQFAAVSPILEETVPPKAFSYSTVAVSPAVAPVSYSIPQDASPHFISYNAVPGVAVSENVSPVVSSSHVVSYNKVSGVSVSNAVQGATVSEDVSPHVISYNVVPRVAASPVDSTPLVVSYNSVPSVAGALTVGTTSRQYHAQDALGQYSYGYVGGPSAKAEAKSLDGIVRGGYSYIDANGLIQSASYIADNVHGFRVAATNVPVAPEPAVAEA